MIGVSFVFYWPPSPMMPTRVPFAAPFFFSGSYIVMPAHMIGLANITATTPRTSQNNQKLKKLKQIPKH